MSSILILLMAFSLGPTERARIKEMRTEGRPDVAYAYKHAGAEYRDAIPRAVARFDPDGLHPDWENELWRICHRESWCGKWGTPKVHAIDSWAGGIVYLHAVSRGKLDPEKCEEHRLVDYAPVQRALKKLERKRGKKRPELRARIDALPLGEYSASEFSTNGAFGMMAAGNLWRLGDCKSPREFSDPYTGAYVAAHLFDSCKKWDTNPSTGRRFKRTCTCQEHNAIWMGVGKHRSLLHYERRSRAARQCGPQPPLTIYELASDGYSLISRYWRAALALAVSAVV